MIHEPVDKFSANSDNVFSVNFSKIREDMTFSMFQFTTSNYLLYHKWTVCNLISKKLTHIQRC